VACLSRFLVTWIDLGLLSSDYFKHLEVRVLMFLQVKGGRLRRSSQYAKQIFLASMSLMIRIKKSLLSLMSGLKEDGFTANISLCEVDY